MYVTPDLDQGVRKRGSDG